MGSTHEQRGQAHRQAILVFGMHRSGTSSMAGVLSLLGAEAPKTLEIANRWNEKGYWESKEIMNFHDRLLHSADSNWKDWAPFDPTWLGSPRAEAFSHEFAPVLAREFGEAPLFVMKDPRACRFAPFWLGELKRHGIAAKIVLPVRNPLEVAQSLERRDGMAPTEALLLWLRHCLDAEAATRGLPRSFQRYEALIDDWRGVARKIGDDLGIAWPAWSPESETKIDAFLTRELRHNVASWDELSLREDVFAWVKGTYECLLALAEGGGDAHAKKILAQLDDIRHAFNEASGVFATLVARHRSAAQQAKGEAVGLKKQLDTERESVRQAKDEAKGLGSELETSRKQIGDLREALGRAETDMAQSIRREEALRAEAKATAERAEELRETLLRSDAALAEARRHEEAQRKDVAAGAREIGALQERLSRLDADLAGAKRQEESLRADLSARDANVRRLEAEAAETKAALEVERAGRAAAEAETARLVEATREFDDPAVRNLARVVRRGARLGRRMKELATLDGALPGRRRQRRHKRRLARDAELVAGSGLFDPEWYLRTYPDVAAAGEDPLIHYLQHGVAERRNPNALFDTGWYLSQYPDVAETGLNPLVHYVARGAAEKRDPGPPCGKKTPQKKADNPDLPTGSFGFDVVTSEKWIRELRSHPAATRVLRVKPLVSIILPTRDRAAILPNAIRSVLAQTYANWELLIVDDRSLDGTIGIVESEFRDPRITILKNDGAGVCDARNHGLQKAAGEFIAYLDSDNVWTPEFLELMLCEMERSGADCAYAILKCIRENADGGGTKLFYRQEKFDYEKLKFKNYIDLNVFVHRRSLFEELGGFDTNLKRMVDWDLILRYTLKNSVSFVPAIGTEYDDGPSPDRITNKEPISYLNVIRNKHWIDWNSLAEASPARNEKLVSIIICIYGKIELTEQCLTSLFKHEAGENFELVLVDNGSDAETIARLEGWAARNAGITLIKNQENMNFAFGNNIGFAASRGSRVVFLNNDTEVTPEWLSALVRPLDDPEIMGAQPKLLFPNGTIQGAGIVFSSRSPMGYPIYVEHPGDFAPTQRSRNYSAITAACVAFRAMDFARARGFDPIFINGQEDIDLCFRIGGGRAAFRYVADSVVFHHEGQTPGRGKHIEANRRVFRDRWKDVVQADDTKYYEQDDVRVETYVPDNADWAELGYAVWRPTFFSNRTDRSTADHLQMDSCTIAIKIGCPRPELKDQWGDYHFAVSLASAFARKGVRARVDFLESWESSVDNGDINLVLRGLSRFEPKPGSTNLMWMISHPDKVTEDEIEGFDYVFVASQIWADVLKRRCTVPVESLLQCTDMCRFLPDAFDERVRTDRLFVANSRKILRPIVREAMAQDVDLDIFGEMWEALAPDHWVKGRNIKNLDLPRYYASANVVLNDHWDSMREWGFISNRIFDALACGAPVVTDSVAGLPSDLERGCHFFDRDVPFGRVIELASREPKKRSDQTRALSDLVRREHSFDARAGQILDVIRTLTKKSIEKKNVPSLAVGSPGRPASEAQHGVSRLHVGCGPKNLLDGWWNVDIRHFPGVDQVMDVTKPWPWNNVLDYVYGEHFLEHLTIGDAMNFLVSAGNALHSGGRIRLSTPSLEWVLSSHFPLDIPGKENRINQTWAINRAFKGWGHQFLYSREMLAHLIKAIGFEDVTFFDYGLSNDPNLKGLERHGGWSRRAGFPSVWIVEAKRGTKPISIDGGLARDLKENFQKYVDANH